MKITILCFHFLCRSTELGKESKLDEVEDSFLAASKAFAEPTDDLNKNEKMNDDDGQEDEDGGDKTFVSLSSKKGDLDDEDAAMKSADEDELPSVLDGGSSPRPDKKREDQHKAPKCTMTDLDIDEVEIDKIVEHHKGKQNERVVTKLNLILYEKKGPCRCKRSYVQSSNSSQHTKLNTGGMWNKRFGSSLASTQSFRSFGNPKKKYKKGKHSAFDREKKYECDDCGTSFTQASHLRRHSLLHAEVKPYQCDICFKPFTRTDTLKRHKESHDNNTISNDPIMIDD